MIQEQLVKESVENSPPPPQGLHLHVILKFFSMWLSSLLVLVIIALLSNIEWARRHIETGLRHSFHREVRLGKLSWSFGLHGLAIDTDRFEMKELDGNPFISSGPSEIGIAFLPLFDRRLVIKHLMFVRPEVWANRIDGKRWNYSDLVTVGPEIHMVQVQNGKLHLRNQQISTKNAADNWESYDLQDIKLSLVLPSHERNWPLFLSCRVPLKDNAGKDYVSILRLSATGKGAFEDWQKNKYSVDMLVQDFDPKKFRPLFQKLPDVEGLCEMHFKGEGIFEQGFIANATGSVKNLKLATSERKELQLDKAGVSAGLVISPDTLQWKNLQLALSSWNLNSDGKLSNWQKDSPSYEARVGGQLSDLKGFFDNVITSFLPEQTSAVHKKYSDTKLANISQAQKKGELAGSATIELRLKGDKNTHSVATNIKAAGIPLAQLVDDELGNNFMDALKLSPTVPITGELNIDPGKRLEVKDLEIPLEDSKLKLTGFMDQATNKSEFNFSADNLSFDTFKKRLGSENSFVKAICSANGKSKPYAVTGIMDIKGKYSSDGEKPDLFLDGTLKGLRLTRQDSTTPSYSNIKGHIIYKTDQVEIKQLSGTTAASTTGSAGNFFASGYFGLKDGGDADIELRAHEVAIAHLKDWMTRFGVKIEPGVERLSGDLHELKAHLLTKKSKSDTSFTLNPADLQINLAAKASDGSNQIFRLNSGTISYDNYELTASDVGLTSHGGKLVVSGNMHGPLEALKLGSARLKSDGFDLADLQSMLKGYVSSSKSVSSLPDLLTPNPASSLHGKVYGDIQLSANGGVAGVIGFNNGGGKFGKTQVPVDKLTGVAVITKDQLVLQDTSGQIGKSTFSIDGVISNYATSNFNWQGQLRGQFFPGEVDMIMDNLGHGIALDSSGNEALDLRVTGSGDKNTASCNFRGKSSSTYGLGLKTAFGTFHQPKGRPLTFHGGLSLSDADSQITLSSFQLSSATENLQANGTFKWANDKEEKPASLSFALVTPTPVKTATLLEIISQTDNGNPIQMGGTSQLNMKVDGPVNDLVLSGSIALDKNSLPTAHIDNISGKLDLPGWHISKGTNANNNTSIAKLQLSTLAMGGLNMHDAGSTLSLDGSNKIVFKDFQAALSGGKVMIGGYYNPQSQAYHADVTVSKLVVDEFVKDLIDHSTGFSGLADLTLTLDNAGGGESPRSLSGTGQFSIYQGSLASFGKLQEKLNEANLLQQGLFGFNVNNLLQAMMPVKSGQFSEVSGKLNISKGNILFDQIRFEGANLRMRAAGKFDFLGQNVDIDVAGDVPRVSTSIIPGAIGEMSRKVTLQRMFSIVTFKKLKDLPALPLLGDIANDEPRAFTFSVETATEPPKLMTQAAEKSFKWLPNKPFASAHPVPGI